jgi:hypothetical protein
MFDHDSFDGSSNSSSYARSACSTASLASSATDLSKNSGYTAVQIAKATKELILILQDDEGLVPLYKRAIRDVLIGPTKLERNLRRFFKSYAEHLGDLAGDRLEHLASRLVRLKARLVARSIMEKYDTGRETSQRVERSSRQEQEQSSDEENETHSVDETELHDLVSFRDFLVGSEAFGTLHTQIRSFTLPKTAQGGEVEAATENVETSHEDEKNSREEDGLATEDVETTTGDIETMMKNVDNTTDDIETTVTDSTTARMFTVMDKAHVAQGRISAGCSRPFAKLIEFTKGFAGLTLITLGYLERPIQPGFTRLRWQCVSKSKFGIKGNDLVVHRHMTNI